MVQRNGLNMTRFRHANTKRRIAATMLVFWLFALASSWANACVLQDRYTHVHASANAGSPNSVTISAGHAGLVPAHGDETVPGDAVCLEVCNAALQTSVQPDRAIDLPGGLVLGPPLSLAWAPDVPFQARALETAAAPPPRATVPQRTLLSRLAL